MNATDQQKLVRAGYTIIRAEGLMGEGTALRIKFKGAGGHEWKTLEKNFASKASLRRRMDEMLRDEKVIED